MRVPTHLVITKKSRGPTRVFIPSPCLSAASRCWACSPPSLTLGDVVVAATTWPGFLPSPQRRCVPVRAAWSRLPSGPLMSGRDLLARSGLLRPGRRVPSESTIRRIFQALDADELSAMVGAWLLVRDATRWKGRMVWRSTAKPCVERKLVTWQRRICWPLSPAAGSWPGNTSSPRRPARSPPYRFCRDSLPSNKIVVTADALHTQRSTVCTLTGQGHDYVLADGERQPAPPADRAQGLALEEHPRPPQHDHRSWPAREAHDQGLSGS